MFCPNCGATVVDGDRFCQRCGRPLPADAGGVTGTPGTDPSGDAPTPAAHESPAAQPSPPPAPQRPATPYVPEAYPASAPGSAAPWISGQIEGPDLAPFGLPLARWWQRVGAMVLDALAVGIPTGILFAILNATLGTDHTVVIRGTSEVVKSIHGMPEIFVYLLSFAINATYFAILNGSGNGQTVGNRAPGIAVRDLESGELIGIKRALLRWFVRSILYCLLVIPGLVNDLYPLWDKRNQTIADKAAHSVMIRLR